LVLAASEDELGAAWPIGLLVKAVHLSARRLEGDAVHVHQNATHLKPAQMATLFGA